MISDRRASSWLVQQLSAAGRRRGGVVALVFAFAVVMATSSAPASLYVLYAARLGFGSFTTASIFSAYPVGVIIGLFLLGSLSDRVGRRRAIGLGLALLLLSDATFLIWITVPGLLAARVITGVAVGAVTSAASAQLGEIGGVRDRGQSDRLAVVVNLGGVACGPLISGALAQLAPDPLHVTFVVLGTMASVAFAGLILVPETAPSTRVRTRYRTQQIRVPPDRRAAFGRACAWGFLSFTVLSLSSSLVPGFLRDRLHDHSALLGGFVVSLVVAAAAGGQLTLRRLGPTEHIRLGIVAAAVGMSVATIGVSFGITATFVIGLATAGAGSGAVFRGCLTSVRAMAPQNHRAETLAGLYAACYLGAVSVVPLGVLVDASGAPLAMSILTVVLGIAAAGVWLTRDAGVADSESLT